jgi:2-keto-4-pentenoate hydratase/2-oxohepta-3-ene-1,7-dioic acid hydratase in catechol pathway
MTMPSAWSIVTYQLEDDVALAVLRSDGSVVAPPELKQWESMLELLEDWDRAVEVLRTLPVLDAPSQDHDRLLAPVRWPRKVICAGVNYRRHVLEMGGDIPGPGWRPFFFLKPPTTTVIGPYDPIVVHSPEATRYDWEAELAVVIGIGGQGIDIEDALDHLAGYCVANDVTARALHKREVVPGSPFVYDWFAAKAIDGSLPLGPGITPAFLVADPQDLRLRLWVNGELNQDESTGDMICTVAELVSEASQRITLEPGDVISTGTPSGVGSSRGLYLRDGDIVRTTIDGLGTIENPVVDPSERTP